MRRILAIVLVAVGLIGCGDSAGQDSPMPDASVDVGFDSGGDAGLRDEPIPFGEPMTTSAVVTLEHRPGYKAALLSRWRLEGEQRAWEFGVDAFQRPYLTVSEDGTWGEAAVEVVSDKQLRLGKTYLATAVFAPADTIVLYLNGTEVGRRTSNIPGGIYESGADLAIGHRAGDPDGLQMAGTVGEPVVEAAAWSPQQVRRRAAELGLDRELENLSPVRQITQGPNYHWFGYYDKLQVDPSGRYVLSNQIDFENRRPAADDVLEVGMIDLQNDDEWIKLGESTAWNWQQGCMLQWRPGSDHEVLWNDREGDHYVTRILNTDTDQIRTLPRPIHSVSPTGEFAIGSDFRRWDDMRPGYSYVALDDPYEDELAPAESTLYRINLDTGASEDILTLAEVADYPYPYGDLDKAKHYLSPVQMGPRGEKFNFYDRWHWTEQTGGDGRVFTADVDGSNLKVLAQRGNLSHITWYDADTIVMWTGANGGYTRYEVGGDAHGNVLDFRNGHQTFLPNKRWMLTDTYVDVRGEVHPFLYDTETDEIFELGPFDLPPAYGGKFRVDTHPRQGPNGDYVIIDSAQSGGRQMYMIDIREIVGN